MFLGDMPVSSESIRSENSELAYMPQKQQGIKERTRQEIELSTGYPTNRCRKNYPASIFSDSGYKRIWQDKQVKSCPNTRTSLMIAGRFSPPASMKALSASACSPVKEA
jgi:hypothetical protein